MCVYTQKSQWGKVTDGEREFGLIAVFTATHLFRIHPRLLPLLDIFRCVCVWLNYRDGTDLEPPLSPLPPNGFYQPTTNRRHCWLWPDTIERAHTSGSLCATCSQSSTNFSPCCNPLIASFFCKDLIFLSSPDDCIQRGGRVRHQCVIFDFLWRKTVQFDIMSEFEPIPEENPRQSGSRSTQKEGGSSDRKSKSGDKHAGREKKARSSKTRSSKGESSSSGQAGQVHGRSGSNSSSKSAKKSEPLISLTSTVDVDMAIAETNSVHGIVPFYFSFVCPLILALIVVWTCKMENVTMLNSLSACSLLLLLQCPCSLSVLRSSAFFNFHQNRLSSPYFKYLDLLEFMVSSAGFIFNEFLQAHPAVPFQVNAVRPWHSANRLTV